MGHLFTDINVTVNTAKSADFHLCVIRALVANGIFTLHGTGAGTSIVNGTGTIGNNESWCLSLSHTMEFL